MHLPGLQPGNLRLQEHQESEGSRAGTGGRRLHLRSIASGDTAPSPRAARQETVAMDIVGIVTQYKHRNHTQQLLTHCHRTGIQNSTKYNQSYPINIFRSQQILSFVLWQMEPQYNL